MPTQKRATRKSSVGRNIQKPAQPGDESYLTTADALVYLNTTLRTLYRRLANGDIPAMRVGHQWRFRKSDLDRWVEAQSPRRPARESAALRDKPRASKRRILVADDEPAICETLTSILAITDCDIDAVPDGAAAVARLRAASYDLLIADLRMPGLDGLQVASEAKRLSPEIKVIVITAYPSQSSAIDAVNIGVDGYVTKPFRPIDVLIATARALDLGQSAGGEASGK